MCAGVCSKSSACQHKRTVCVFFFFSFFFIYLFLIFIFSFIFIIWRLITLQYCSAFCHTLTCVCVLKVCTGISLPFINSILWKGMLLMRIIEQVQLDFILPPLGTVLSREISCSRCQQPQSVRCREVVGFWRKLALVLHTGNSDKLWNLEFSISMDIFLTEVTRPQWVMVLIWALLYLHGASLVAWFIL